LIDGNTNQIIKSATPAYFSELLMVNSNMSQVFSGTTILNADTLEQITPNLNNEIAAVDSVHNIIYTVAYSTNLSRLDGLTRNVLSSVKLYRTYYLYSDRTAINSNTMNIYVIHGAGTDVVVISELPSVVPLVLTIVFLGTAITYFVCRNRKLHTNDHAS
jgi:hypothetical protein